MKKKKENKKGEEEDKRYKQSNTAKYPETLQTSTKIKEESQLIHAICTYNRLATVVIRRENSRKATV